MTTVSGGFIKGNGFMLRGFFGVVSCLIVLQSGCAQTDISPSTSPPQSSWPTYEDSDAQAYIAQCQRQYDAALSQLRELEKKSFPQQTGLLTAINQLDVLFNESLGFAGLYANVHPNSTMRAAGDVCEQKMTSLENDIQQSPYLYKQLAQVNLAELNEIDRQYASRRLQLSKLKGAHLPDDKRERIRELNDAVVKTGQDFSTNIRNDTRQVELSPGDLRGLPEDYIAAHPANNAGKVVLTTDNPDYLPVMLYAHNDSARLQMYKAFRQRGYPANREVLKKLLVLRRELAGLLGYDNFADYITADKMIGAARNAEEFIDQTHQVVFPRAQQDYAALLQRLQQIDPSATSVGDWQKSYIENLIKNDVYVVDAQEVRRYFSYPKVRQGIFDLVENLFQVSIKPWQTQVWHESVQAYQIWDSDKLIGQFYLDMHPREGKYQHAAHFGLRDGVVGVQTPLAALVCNFPGGDGGAGLLEHDQVETFLHEFGHLLHTMFGGQLPWVSLAGTNVQRDFVEAPSMMLEEWVWDRDTLQTFATDAEGKVIPDALITKMNAARDFGKGIFVRQQLFYAALSLNYYRRDPQELDLDAVMVELQERYSPFAYVEDTYFYTSFGHLDGYSAIYYTYMWSLALATDMFSEFQRAGLSDRAVAKRYRDKVLAPGASKPAAQLVEDFLGRPFSLDAFAKSLETE
jgi:thimet oligopeptidase